MWTANAIAIYSSLPPSLPVLQPGVKPRKTSSSSSSSKPPVSPALPKPEQTSASRKMSNTNADFFGPALERPPSPARLRQLNRQMKRTSHVRRQNGHRAAASASSSLTSLNSEFPGWEQALENLSLVRRSSTRSVDSNGATRDRSESFYGFGKNMFHRRRKSTKRESSANSSSSSSLYSTDTPADSATAVSKESFMPTLFARRKPSRDETVQKKFQISSPFNFQHVLHTHRDDVPAMPEHIPEQAPDLLTMRATGPGTMSAQSAMNIFESRDFPLPPEISNETNMPFTAAASLTRPPLIPRHTAPASGPRRLMRRIRSQDQLRIAPSISSPPRPPRSPTHSTAPQSFFPAPPPRVSSRQGTPDGNELAATRILERPKTSGGFRRPRPYSPTEPVEPLPTFLSLHRPSTPKRHEGLDIYGTMPSPVPSPSPVEAAWPLSSPTITTFETPLPDVPEEEELYNAARLSRLSLISTRSSLRACQSVPMLRSLAKSQRPLSGASETLGHLDMVAVQQAVVEGAEECHGFDFGITDENWEDDIDYCYEHEAEATCDYQWERCSMDTARDTVALPVEISLAAGETSVPIGMARSSPGMLSVPGFDTRALSPVSQASTLNGHEATTPTSLLPMASNFSLPLVDKRNLRASYASSFRESHGFNLSPSLLIPGDFHQQMLLAGRHEYPEAEELMASFQQAAYDEATTHIGDRPLQWSQQRSSTSTTGTSSTYRSDSTGERHVSANSSCSLLTRVTGSSTSLNKMAGSWTEASEPAPATQPADQAQNGVEQDDMAAASQDTVPELTPFPLAPGRKRSHHKPHASESIIRDDVVSSLKSFEAGPTRRSRARTTSMGGQAPPVGQYALFPRSYIKPSGDRI